MYAIRYLRQLFTSVDFHEGRTIYSQKLPSSNKSFDILQQLVTTSRYQDTLIVVWLATACDNKSVASCQQNCCKLITVEGGELGRWCELRQNFSDSSPLLLLVKGHWCAMGQKFSAL